MRLFKRKTNCKVVVDNVSNLRVRKFARTHKADKTDIRIREYGGFSTIDFKTLKTAAEIFERLKKELDIFYDVEMKEGLMFVTEKEQAR